MRMLDNVIDINYYAVDEGAQLEPASIARWASASWASRIACTCCACRTRRDEAVEFADRSMEAVCYYAYWASTELAEERGRYASLSRASLWDRGILPQDTLEAAARRARRLRRGRRVVDDGLGRAARAHQAARHAQLQLRRDRADRDDLQHHRRVAPRSSPTYQNLYVKSNLSGEFTVVNEYLVRDLKTARPVGRGDGRRPQVLRRLARARSIACPQDLRELYATAFEVEPKWLVEAGARRQKWIDQAQSLNIYMAGASGKKLDETYKLAWLRGLKTTYYLRTLGATHAEKSTGQGGRAQRGVAGTIEAAQHVAAESLHRQRDARPQ